MKIAFVQNKNGQLLGEIEGWAVSRGEQYAKDEHIAYVVAEI